MRTTASPPGSTPYLSRKSARSSAIGARPRWNIERGGWPSYRRRGDAAPLFGNLCSPPFPPAAAACCCSALRENMRFTMDFFFVFPVVVVLTVAADDEMAAEDVSDSPVRPPANPSAVSSISGTGEAPAAPSLSGREPTKLRRLLRGRSICFRFPSRVSSPLMTRSAKPTGMAKVGGRDGWTPLPSADDADCISPRSSNI
mmetsp:Transcript_31052/g.66090  ORF Transcript_31052/g.66090 Transcript_31052/m.66090 type:complete len:200 (-) Transcript_31052:424-1023(-)